MVLYYNTVLDNDFAEFFFFHDNENKDIRIHFLRTVFVLDFKLLSLNHFYETFNVILE